MFDDDVLKTGTVVDARFTLARRLGHGAFGVVWLATDGVMLGREIALKVLHTRFGDAGGPGERLAREAAVLARMDHPNIARAVAFSGREELTYLATEYVDGQPLHEFMAAQGGVLLSLGEVSRIFDELCSAVAYAHAQNVIHRDLKPQNVMIQRRGTQLFVKVLDFGVAKVLEGGGDGTTQGRTIGSLFYLSPEQTRGDPTTLGSDQFALGSMLFELLTLRRMWARDRNGGALPAFTVPLMSDAVNSLPNVLERIVGGPRPKATDYRHGLPGKLDAVIARAAAVDAEDRYPSVEALRQDVVAILASASRAASTTDTSQEDVRPVDHDDPEEELKTLAGGGLSQFEAQDVHVRTQQVEGGVSAFIESEERVKTRPPPMPEEEPALPTVQKTRVAPTPDEPPLLPTSPDLRRVMSLLEPLAAPPVRAPTKAPAQRGGWVIALAVVAAAVLGIVLVTTEAPRDPPQVIAPIAPAVVAVPAAKAAPVETPTPTATPTPVPAAPKKPVPSPKKPRSELAALLESARQAPADAARLAALATAIDRAAEKVTDVAAKKSIRRVASSSAMVGNLTGLEQAYRDLRDALERSGQAMP